MASSDQLVLSREEVCASVQSAMAMARLLGNPVFGVFWHHLWGDVNWFGGKPDDIESMDRQFTNFQSARFVQLSGVVSSSLDTKGTPWYPLAVQCREEPADTPDPLGLLYFDGVCICASFVYWFLQAAVRDRYAAYLPKMDPAELTPGECPPTIPPIPLAANPACAFGVEDLVPNDQVVAVELRAAADLNGQVGTLVRYEASNGRWAVKFPTKTVLVRPRNLQFVHSNMFNREVVADILWRVFTNKISVSWLCAPDLNEVLDYCTLKANVKSRIAWADAALTTFQWKTGAHVGWVYRSPLVWTNFEMAAPDHDPVACTLQFRICRFGSTRLEFFFDIRKQDDSPVAGL